MEGPSNGSETLLKTEDLQRLQAAVEDPANATAEWMKKKNLIINYLPQSYTQEEIKKLFGAIGPVKNCKLVKDHASGLSLGYAFVEYEDPDDSTRAISKLDKLRVENKTIRVSFARPSSSDIKNANLYVSGLPPYIDEDKLAEIFKPFGLVITHKVLYNPDGTSKGVGFVRFDKRSEAQEAIDKMNLKKLDTFDQQPLTVKYAIPPAVKNVNAQVTAMANMGFGGMGITIPATRANVRYNPMAATAGPIISTMPTVAASHALSTRESGPMEQHTRSSVPWCVYVYGLPPTTQEFNLYKLFSPFGAILNVRVMRDLTKADQPCKGFAFVNFMKYEDAYRSIQQMNGQFYEGKHLQVSFKTGGGK